MSWNQPSKLHVVNGGASVWEQDSQEIGCGAQGQQPQWMGDDHGQHKWTYGACGCLPDEHGQQPYPL